MQNTERGLRSIIDNEALVYAMYTVENRAIPNMVDGLKPVQRFILYRAIEMAKGKQDKFHKLASIAGGVADAGYHHGEGSAQEAGALMANTWNNNFPILDGEGNFGSRLVQQAAASRYIFSRVSDNFRIMFKDSEIAPKHEDIEHLPPRHYLPVIPFVLLNGIRGIATGYSTSILPHDPKSVLECTRAALNGTLDKEPVVAYPQFRGSVICTEKGKYELHGKYEILSKTQMYISEIPYQFDRAKYVEKVLDPLEDRGLITYDDDCSKSGFGFKIKFRKDYTLPQDPVKLDEKIKADFKLIERVSQNIVVIDENGKLNDKFESASQLIEHFVKVRLKFVEERIKFMIEKSEKTFKLALAKALFIKEVNEGKIIVKGKTKAELKAELSEISLFVGFEEQCIAMNIYQLTDDEMASLKEKAKSAKAEMEYWKTTTSIVEYNKDLDELEKLL